MSDNKRGKEFNEEFLLKGLQSAGFSERAARVYIDLVISGPVGPKNLAAKHQIPDYNMSNHLNILTAIGVVTHVRRSPSLYHAVDPLVLLNQNGYKDNPEAREALRSLKSIYKGYVPTPYYRKKEEGIRWVDVAFRIAREQIKEFGAKTPEQKRDVIMRISHGDFRKYGYKITSNTSRDSKLELLKLYDRGEMAL